jgi:hypothetical protein
VIALECPFEKLRVRLEQGGSSEKCARLLKRPEQQRVLNRLRYRPPELGAEAGNRHDRINREIPNCRIVLGSSRQMRAGFQWLPGMPVWRTRQTLTSWVWGRLCSIRSSRIYLPDQSVLAFATRQQNGPIDANRLRGIHLRRQCVRQV